MKKKQETNNKNIKGEDYPHPKVTIIKKGMYCMNNEIFKDYPDVVTPEDVQNMLHIGRNRVYELLKTNTIKSIKVGKKYIIPKKSVINFLQLAV